MSPTPAGSPPPKIGMQHSGSFNMGAHGMQNGMPMQRNGYMAYGDVNGYAQHQPAPEYAQAFRPQIYKATYSNTQVYEMEVNGVAVMRRRTDSWLNATQILKVAGVEKGKRTKILEREILAGEYEKVQGGYGKYQGTWISYPRGVEFCRQYGVEELLRPLLEHDMGQGGIAAGQGGDDTPTKEQAQAAQRRRMYAAGLDDRPRSQSQGGTFFKSISNTAANAVSAIGRARFDSPAPRPVSGFRPPPNVRRSSQQMFGSQESFPGGSQQSFISESSFGGVLDSSNTTQSSLMPSIPANGDLQEPPRKRLRPTSSQDQQIQVGSGPYDHSIRDATPTEPNDSFVYHQHESAISTQMSGIVARPPLPMPTNEAEIEKKRCLTSLFSTSTEVDPEQYLASQGLSGDDLDIPVDTAGHTTLHWASSMARIPLMKALITRGASIFRVSSGGETPLMTAVLAINAFDQKAFPQVLELLCPTIGMRDGLGRTILHHIVVSAAIDGRALCSKYYLETLLEFIVRKGSNPNSQQSSFDGQTAIDITTPTPMGIAQFIGDIVNAQDNGGNTALMQAVKASHPNSSIIKQLLEIQADPYIANRGGLRPVDFGLSDEIEGLAPPQSLVSTRSPAANSAPDELVEELRKSLSSSFGKMIHDASEISKRELQSKQQEIDKVHASIREQRAQIAHIKKLTEEAMKKKREHEAFDLKMKNLKRMNRDLKEKVGSMSIKDDVGKDAKIRTDMKVGEADKKWRVDASNLPSIPPHSTSSLSQDKPASPPNKPLRLTAPQYAYIQTLPAAPLLASQLAAYKANNQQLEAWNKEAEERSSDKEAAYRKFVAKLLSMNEEEVDRRVLGMRDALSRDLGRPIEEIRGALEKVGVAGKE
ncbi:MAG: transcriptional regulator swi6 [Cirrosporium novae-zelandiae]|nr:MAG: transcriptional regulator swi6 [Cirrosporium novae-zelandiae]